MNNYPFTISNKVNVLKIEGKIAIEQKITMLDDKDENSKILFNFQETKIQNNNISYKSIAKIEEKDGKNYLSLDLSDKLKNLPENIDKNLLEILNKDALEINCPPPAVELKNKGSEIIVSVSSTDNKPYTITIGSSSIKIQFQDIENKDSCAIINLDPEESHIDISMQRKVIEDIIIGENPLYKPSKIQANSNKNAIPQSLLYLYLRGIEKNTNINLGDYNISHCSFDDKTEPFYFIRRKNDTLLYTNGGLRKCNNFFFQHDSANPNSPALIIEGSGNVNTPYYKIPISNTDQFNTAFELMFYNSQLNYNDPRNSELKKADGPQKITNSNITNILGENVHSFNEDLRNYAVHSFDYKPKTIDQSSQSAFASQNEEDNTLYNNLYFLNSDNGKQSSEQRSDAAIENENLAQQNADSLNNSNDFVSTENDTNSFSEDTNKKEEAVSKTSKKDSKKENLAPTPTKEIDKENVKNVTEAISNSIMGVGIWLGICCLIPGVNVIAAIIALSLVVSGALLNTYSDKIADFKFRAAEKKVKEYEDEEADNVDFKENFIENEHELEKLQQISNEKISNLEKMMSPPENGGNFVANAFAQNYNENGVGFIHKDGQPENYGIKNLISLDSLSTKQSLAENLNNIKNETNLDVKNDLIKNFTQTYFTDLEPQQSQQLAEMFLPDHDKELEQFISALNDANKAQKNENDLYNSQKEEIEKSNEKRLKYLFSHTDLSQEEREHFIDRYGFSILKSYTINNNISTEKVEALIDSLPPEQREMASSKFYQISNASKEKIKDISTIAKEEHEKNTKMDQFVDFAESMLKTSDENYFAFFSQCKENTADFLLKYTHLAYSKSVDKLKNKFTFTENGKTLLPPTSNPIELVVFHKMKNFVEKSTEKSELTETLVNYQQVKKELIKKYYSEDIAKLYLENKTSDFYTDGIAPNPATFTSSSKEYSQEEIATKFAKQDLIDFISQNFDFDSKNKDKMIRELSKKSLAELASMITLEDEEGKPKSLAITIDEKQTKVAKYPTKETTEDKIAAFDRAEHAYLFGKVCNDYNDLYNKNITNIFAELTKLNGIENPIFKIEKSKKDKISFSYEVIGESGEKEIKSIPLSLYQLRYPQLKTFPIETQKDIILTLLSAEYRKNNFERKSTTEKDTNKILELKQNEDKVLNTYKMAINLCKSMLNSHYRDAVYQTTFELGLDGTLSNVSYKDVKLAAKNTNQSLNGFIHLGQTFDLFGEKNTRTLLEHFNALHEASPHRDASDLVRDALENIIGKKEKLQNGEIYLDIVNRYFTNAKATPKDIKAFEKFIKEQKGFIDKQTELTLASYCSSLGDKFSKKEIQLQRQGIIDKTVPTYNNYIELFSEFGLNKSEVAKVLVETDDFDKGIEELIKRAGITDKELEQYKIKKDKIKISQFDESTKELYKLYKKQYDIEKTYTEYDSIMNTLLNGSPNKDDLVSLVERLGNIDSKLLKKLGINLNDVTKLIPNENLTKEDLEKLSALHEKNQKLYIRGSTKLKQDIIKNNEIVQGETKLDKKSIAAETEYRTFKARSLKFKHDFGIIYDFISKNPKNSEINKILEAFVKGDNEFFELRDNIGLKDLDDINIAVFESAGIDLKKISSLAKIKNKSKLIKKLQILNDKMQRRLEQEEKRKEKEAKEIKAKAQKEKDNKVKTNISTTKHTSIGNALSTLAKIFQRKATKEGEIRVERENAKKEIEQAKLQEKEQKKEQVEEANNTENQESLKAEDDKETES